jgi:hypothetical protein
MGTPARPEEAAMGREDEQRATSDRYERVVARRSHRPAASPAYRRRAARSFLTYLRRVAAGLAFILFVEMFAVCMLTALTPRRLGYGPAIDFSDMLLLGPLYIGVPLVLLFGLFGQDADHPSTDAPDSDGDLSD